jgi:hypothetical protein
MNSCNSVSCLKSRQNCQMHNLGPITVLALLAYTVYGHGFATLYVRTWLFMRELANNVCMWSGRVKEMSWRARGDTNELK